MDSSFIQSLRTVVDDIGIVEEFTDRIVYECDALSSLRAVPGVVVLPSNTDQLQDVVRLCHNAGVPFVARGNGTGLSGGARPEEDGVLIVLTRLNRILDVDPSNLRMTVQPGVTNLDISRRAAPFGLYYAPDPSSQQVCSIGGNVAENSGGAHCLKYGFTLHHVLGLEAVLPDGTLVHFGGPVVDTPGFDLVGSLVGSEGTLAIVTKVILRLLRVPESVRTLLAAFESIDSAGKAVSGIIAAGIVPAAAEMMDRLTIEAAEAAVNPGFPPAEAVLIIEVDGPEVEVDETSQCVEAICRDSGSSEVRVAGDAEERSRFWTGRKAAFAAMGRVSPDYYVQDGVIPRTKLPEVLQRIRSLEQSSGLRIGNVFHAGDGNLHPLICYDASVEGQSALAAEVGGEILRYCLEAGGSITGEHGVGADKVAHMAKMFSEVDLETMQFLRFAFDPTGICNPRKIFPTPRLCGEVPGPYRAHPVEQAGLAERF